MCELDKELDINPTPEKIIEIVELGIRNRICFSELQCFNQNGKFLHKHPLIQKNSTKAVLIDLMRNNPQAFLEEHKNVSNNISRYKSYLNRKKAKEKDKLKWQAQLSKHMEKLNLMSEVIQEFRNGNI